MKIRTGTTREAQGQPEPAWVGPALELAAGDAFIGAGTTPASRSTTS